MSIILGITPPTSSNVSTTLIKDGKILGVFEEDKISRNKNEGGVWPIQSMEYALNSYNLKLEDIDYVAIGEADFNKNIENPIEYRRKIKRHFGLYILYKQLKKHKIEIKFIDHHIAHAYSILPFQKVKCDILTIDGFGDNISGILGIWNPKFSSMEILYKIPVSKSLGKFYEDLSEFVGYEGHSDEGKVMGLTSYERGNVDRTNFYDTKHIPHLETSHETYGDYLEDNYNNINWENKEKLNKRAAKIAAAGQKEFEEVLMKLAKWLYNNSSNNILCLSGGSSLNCIGNMKILYNTNYFDVRATPIPHDGGLSLGAASYLSLKLGEGIDEKWPIDPFKFKLKEEDMDRMKKKIKKSSKFEIKYISKNNEEDAKTIANYLSEGKIISVCKGNGEMGPRALGHRSILSLATKIEYRNKVNKIKNREKWRPLAPSIINKPETHEYYDFKGLSSYYYMNVGTQPIDPEKVKEDYPAVTHTDNSSRPQLIERKIYPFFWAILNNLYEETGNIAVINTSYNSRGEPIPMKYSDCLETFKDISLEYLYLDGIGIVKKVGK